VAARTHACSAETERGAIKLPPEQEARFRAYQFFLQKPRFALINVAESDLGDGPAAEFDELPSYSMSAKLELELMQLDEQDRAEFMKEMGLSSLSRDELLTRLVRGALGHITFFTVNQKELRAWLVPESTPAVEAAGKIHSDLARGFIRAEVVHYDDIVQHGSEQEAKRHGVYHLEGKDYRVQDGDIILFRFNV
jgi:hypothetical protein